MSITLLETTISGPGSEASVNALATALEFTAEIKAAMMLAMEDRSGLDPQILGMPGMSGRRYRMFINNLISSLPDARYLEVGSWAGSTLCSAINNNSVRAVAIDNWSQFGGPKEQFLANLKQFQTSRAYVNFIESDFRKVEFSGLGPFNIYLFDGPHGKDDQYDGLSLALPALDNLFVLIIDDWNWIQVREGTHEAVMKCGLTTHYSIELRTTLDNSHPVLNSQDSDWHNGYYIALMSNTSRA